MKRFAAGSLVLLLLVVSALSMGADQYRINKGIRFHGEFSSADASALTEANSRFTLYGDGSTTPISVSAGDQVIVTDISYYGPVAATNLTIYDGADATVDAGETITKFRNTSATSTNGYAKETCTTPFYCQPGTCPKAKTSSATAVDVLIRGIIYQAN